MSFGDWMRFRFMEAGIGMAVLVVLYGGYIAYLWWRRR